DPKALSSIARHALDPQTAFDAVARVNDAPELLNIALRTDQKEAGVAALEKYMADSATEDTAVRETLGNVIARARNKAVSRRARGLLQAIQDEEASRRMALEHWQQRVASVVARAEAIAANPGLPNAPHELADAEAEWAE